MVYYGDEIGMKGGRDPGCRGTMIWDEKKQDKELLHFMKGLIQARKDHSALRRGTFETLLADSARNIYSFVRRFEGKLCLVVLNNSSQDRTVEIPMAAEMGASTWNPVWPASRVSVVIQDNVVRVDLPAMTGHIFVGGKK
jgi:glycosidase